MQIFWQKVLQKMQKSYFFGGSSQKMPKMVQKKRSRVAIEKVDTWGRKNIVRLDMWKKSINFAPEFKQYGYVYRKGNYLWVNI